MKNILIIGANGFAGRRILDDLLPLQYNITGCSLHGDISPKDGYNFIKADITDPLQVKKVFEATHPDIVINASALSVPDYCEQHKEEAYKTNVTAVEYLTEYCNIYNSRFIHLSTDFVFNGESKVLYSEEDIPAPVNYYGETKYQGERLIEANSRNYAIARVVIIYGKSLAGQHGNIVQLIANKLGNGEPVKVVSDQWRTPTYVGDVSQGIIKLIKHPSNGIYHICGAECMSIADIAFRVAGFLKLDHSLIHPVTTAEMNEATPRPHFSGLSIEKAKNELNYTPHTLEEGMQAMFG